MTKDERGWIVGLLVSSPKFSGCWYDDSIVWEDERPFPTEEEINAKYKEWKKEEDRKKHNKKALDKYNTSIDKGYLHTDGNTYACNDKGITDMALLSTLIHLKPNTPLTYFTLKGKVVKLTVGELNDLAIECGSHHYLLRQEYWGSYDSEGV